MNTTQLTTINKTNQTNLLIKQMKPKKSKHKPNNQVEQML